MKLYGRVKLAVWIAKNDFLFIWCVVVHGGKFDKETDGGICCKCSRKYLLWLEDKP